MRSSWFAPLEHRIFSSPAKLVRPKKKDTRDTGVSSEARDACFFCVCACASVCACARACARACVWVCACACVLCLCGCLCLCLCLSQCLVSMSMSVSVSVSVSVPVSVPVSLSMSVSMSVYVRNYALPCTNTQKKCTSRTQRRIAYATRHKKKLKKTHQQNAA